MAKLYQCKCEHAIFPYGNYAPVCLRIVEQTHDTKDQRVCIEKGCKHYKERTWREEK